MVSDLVEELRKDLRGMHCAAGAHACLPISSSLIRIRLKTTLIGPGLLSEY